VTARRAEGGAAGPVAPRIWLVDKPAGPSSHDVVAAVRRRLGRGVKVGHAGTLDPFASGLLVVLVGRATRLADYLSGLDKTYLATARLGAFSATGDPEGPLTEVGPAPPLREVLRALPSMLGLQRQRVPAHSAVKVGGERLYRRARRGEDLDQVRPERPITVHRLAYAGHDAAGGWVRLEARVSKGTYVRQLVEDLGAALGCGAYCLALARTMVGELPLSRAVPPQAVEREGGLTPREALGHLPARRLTAREAEAVSHGGRVEGDADGPVLLVDGDEALAVAHPDGAGRLRPAVVLA